MPKNLKQSRYQLQASNCPKRCPHPSQSVGTRSEVYVAMLVNLAFSPQDLLQLINIGNQNEQQQINNFTMQKPSSQRSNKSFLQKFQGKKNMISRQGLLHLLDVKKQSFEKDQISRSEHTKQINSKQIKNDPLSKQTDRHIVKRTNNNHEGFSKNLPTSGNDNVDRYAKLRQQFKEPKSLQFMNNKVKLPAINKSSSHTSNIHKKNTQSLNIELEQRGGSTRGKSLKKTENSQSLILNNFTKKMQLDKYALRHLQFLDKFELQLLQNQSSKRSSRLQHP